MLDNYKNINNLVGWLVFIIATLTYALTVEQTASFWDSGEFIAVSYKLEVPHPPGAPFYLLLGRIFSFLALGNEEMVAFWINMVSVVSSGFTILFLFWSITMLSKKILTVKHGEETREQTILLIGSGLVGSLSYTFSDSFWFSATEAEVYGLSSFFTAFVFWAILKWELIENKSTANRWLILIAYMMGLSIGVHLLNLVAIPALALIYYFHNYPNTSTKGVITTLIISLAIIGLIMVGIIPGLPSLAGSFEVFFVNNLGLPFGSGGAFLVILLLGGLIYGLFTSYKRGKVVLNTFLLALTFIIIGYGSYALIPIRSAYDPPIDENDPETLISFVSYLKREQYGSRPLLYGQYFTAELTDQENGAPIYEKGDDKYIITDYKLENTYDPKQSTIFPRAYSTQDNHVELYRDWMGLGPNEKPNFGDNLYFFFRYQVGHMFMRYFMWNFAGRESDIKDAGWLAPWEGNSDLPYSIATNKARNNFFMLPLILGLIGLFYQYKKDLKGFSVIGLLFILTGIGLVVYLNSPPVEPRERDYIYVGAFYAFAIWIGFGVIALARFIGQFMKNRMAAGALATVLCIAAPTVMAAQGWNDHDRSNRYFSVDSARNFLASCAPNAILFTGGDNDTFPLWYVQEVEGFRTDVRVIVLSYFNTDWYIEQMTREAYESEPLPFSLTKENYKQGGPNDYLYYLERPNIKGAINAEQFLRLIKENSQALKMPNARSDLNTIPAKTLFLDVTTFDVNESETDTASLNGVESAELPAHLQQIIPAGMREYYSNRLYIDLKGRGIEKKDLMILDLIVQNKWERPIYFNNTSLMGVNLDFRPYVVQEGNTFRLLPVENPNPNNEFVNTEVMYENMMDNFYWRELANPDVYYNEDYRNFALNHRSSFNTLARDLIQNGDIERAREVLNKSLKEIPDITIPYDYVSSQTLPLLFEVGEEEKALEMAQKLGDRADEMLAYLSERSKGQNIELQKQLIILNGVAQALNKAGNTELGQKYDEMLNRRYNQLNGM
ncbi:glycosyltransferase family 117 protein [Catalinimonas niigatensis]|uniref:glycosyltransferase family 117 protein n=1 Tax=Catalinimonas niigatensis TaxID=1397264 RepID=UPI002666DD3A|nr:DUF2723 domain-containing protein [Catalinimonas niigatensis]WPP51009.1 DUF2723 domain-containing protein [Catalinimonas niigatensis]